MAKVTRQVTQYEVYTLYATVDVVVGRELVGDVMQDIKRRKRVPVAIFDDIDLLKAYATVEKEYEYAEEWRELKPAAGQFSLPFNPTPEEPGADVDVSDNN